jgi:hypothetical protein
MFRKSVSSTPNEETIDMDGYHLPAVNSEGQIEGITYVFEETPWAAPVSNWYEYRSLCSWLGAEGDVS